MGRQLLVSALSSALTTLVAAMALRAADATLAVAAVAAVTVLLTWFAQLHSTDEQSSLGTVNPAAVVILAVVRRTPWGTVLPLVAAHVVGGVLGGLAALGLDDRLGETLVFTEPGLVLAAVGAFVIGLVAAWTVLAVDAGAPDAMGAVPAVVSGALLPLGLLAAFQPASGLGLATAGIVPWDVALTAAAATMVAAVAGAFAVSLLVPTE